MPRRAPANTHRHRYCPHPVQRQRACAQFIDGQRHAIDGRRYQHVLAAGEGKQDQGAGGDHGRAAARAAGRAHRG
ncbi:hypothetical protein G6F57_022901 [Rhizopus arrhizus]|nr:hypothetical protein G6F57_022901 [Rhizopus arrhizus]